MSKAMRWTCGVIGGVGVLVCLWFLFNLYAWSGMIAPNAPPAERRVEYWHRRLVEWPQPLVMSGLFLILNGSFWLLLTATTQRRGALRRLLVSSALATVVIVVAFVVIFVQIG